MLNAALQPLVDGVVGDAQRIADLRNFQLSKVAKDDNIPLMGL